MGSLSRKLHKTTGGQKRTIYVGSSLRSFFEERGGTEELDKLTKLKVLKDDVRIFLAEMKLSHHRDEYARVSQAFVAALGKKYGLPEGWYE